MDIELLKELLGVFKQSGLHKMDVKDKDLEVSFEAKESAIKGDVPTFKGMKELSEIGLEETVDAPMVGTFYRALSPEDKPFVEVGDRVKKGDILCIIEAMKVMNEVKADRDMLICKILVKDGDAVDYGKQMFIVE